MHVDAPIQPLATIATPARPVHTNTEQVSQRPVERPHHSEAANNQGREQISPAGARQEQKQEHHDSQPRTMRQEAELAPEEKRELEKLKARDREVRAHEAAHKNAAGNLARGGAQFSYERGPDGHRYAVGGEVSIDTSKVQGDPEATIRKAQTIRRAANAPAQPSAQDRAVALEANRMEAAARQELTDQAGEPDNAAGKRSNSTYSIYQSSDSEAAPIGSLLDVNA